MAKDNNTSERKEIRKFLIWGTLGVLGLSIVLNYSIIAEGRVYSNTSKMLIVLTIISAIVNILLSRSEKKLLQVTYIGGTMIGNLTLLALYMASMNYLFLESLAAKVIVLSNFILIEILLFTKRIIIKDENYIASIKNGKHIKFIKRDIIFALLMSVGLICLAKAIDSNISVFLMQSFDKQIVVIAGLIISCIGTVVYVTSLANYLFSISNKRKKV